MTGSRDRNSSSSLPPHTLHSPAFSPGQGDQAPLLAPVLAWLHFSLLEVEEENNDEVIFGRFWRGGGRM